MTMLAFHNNPKIAAKFRRRARMHQKADEIVQGTGWESNGKTRGCCVGCLMHAYPAHAEFEPQIGVPEVIAHLADAIHEGLARAAAKKWPVAFIAAIPVGADLSLVWPRFALWMFSNPAAPAFRNSRDDAACCKAVDAVAALFRRWVETAVKPSMRDFAAAEEQANTARAWTWALASASARASASAGAWARASASVWRQMRDVMLRLLSEAPVETNRV